MELNTREYRLKKKILELCDYVFLPNRSKVAKNIFTGKILKHPNLYISEDDKNFYLVVESTGKKTPIVGIFEYICYTTSNVTEKNLDYEEISFELGINGTVNEKLQAV